MFSPVWSGFGIISSHVRTPDALLESAGSSAWLYCRAALVFSYQMEGTDDPNIAMVGGILTELRAKTATFILVEV